MPKKIISSAVLLSMILVAVGSIYLCGLMLHLLIKKPPLISPDVAISLLNDCRDFRVVGPDTRRVVDIKSVAIASASADTDDTVVFNWRWDSGPRARENELFVSNAAFYYSGETKEWSVGTYHTPDGDLEIVEPWNDHCHSLGDRAR